MEQMVTVRLWDPINVYSGPSDLHIVPLSTSSTSLITVRLPMGTKASWLWTSWPKVKGSILVATYSWAVLHMRKNGGNLATKGWSLGTPHGPAWSGICLEHHTTHTCYCWNVLNLACVLILYCGILTQAFVIFECAEFGVLCNVLLVTCWMTMCSFK